MGQFASQMGKAVKKILPRAFPPGRNPVSMVDAAAEYDFDAITGAINATDARNTNTTPPLTAADIPDVTPYLLKTSYQFAVTLHADSTGLHWSDQPAAKTEFNGDTRHRAVVDVSNLLTGRLSTRLLDQGATGAYLTVEWRPYGSSGVFSRLLGDNGLVIDTLGTIAMGWKTIDPDAIAAGDIELRMVGADGDGVLDPEFGLTVIWFRDDATETSTASDIAL